MPNHSRRSTSRSVSIGNVAQAGADKMTFPILEVLVLNGAEVPAIGPGFSLGTGAQAWPEAKRSRESAQKLEHTAMAAGAKSSYTGRYGLRKHGTGWNGWHRWRADREGEKAGQVAKAC